MRTLLLLATFALTTAPAFAGHAPIGRCASEDLPAAGIVEFTGGSAGTTFYLDDRGFLENGVYVYAETNGIWAPHVTPGAFADDLARHNLQRGGSSPFFTMRPPSVDPGMRQPDVCTDDRDAYPDVMVN